MYARGAELRAHITDKKSPIVYGYTGDQLPVYFNQDPVLSTRAAGMFGRSGPAVPGVGQDITPNSAPIHLSPYTGDDSTVPEPSDLPTQARERGAARQALRQGGAQEAAEAAPRVVLAFPEKPEDILLSGELAGGQALSGRALALDQPLGKGHVVMFALRPFWRWQTQGTFALGFNAIVNWDNLNAGAPAPRPARPAAATPGEN
jgi:hypothetical protein